ncbi:protease Do [Planctopirus limnophila DSM 3776]|uniref:Protease Do n=1 Tax=Planctopirus limnophila (strain ATCC 43296 / DSM 3776 / IFAM 1008 / Mu 290) TaxID=521674 RepID=D5SVS2_PLAL2|nr:Do family serine endopeptidase [Planctopirus limnophila]ADG69432.1 protease Do [Planctopirus limnophila DSM 3776]
MSFLSRFGGSLATLSAGAIVAVASMQYAEHTQAVAVPRVLTPGEFSMAFREVASQSLPAIVSIRTLSKGNAANVGSLPGGDDMPLPEFFKNDPRFRDMLKAPRQQRAPMQRGMGSGFVIDASGIIMTNNHVVDGADEVIVTLQNGKEYVAKDIKTDPRTDVAILRIEGAKDLVALPLGDSDSAQPGDWVMAIGSPFGLDTSVTAGIVSGKGRGMGITEREDFIQTDAAVNPGNSGGPLINLRGEVIGINTAISSRSGGYDGVSFSIPINMAQWVSKQLVASGQVKRAYLGTSIAPVAESIALKLGANAGEGVVIQMVRPDSPAAKAGLEPGDVVISVNGVKVNDPRSLQSAVERLDIGKSYPIVAKRQGKELNLSVVAEEMPSDFSRSQLAQSGKPKSQSLDNIGMSIDRLTPSIGRQLGVTGEGVVVTEVAGDSAAEAAGVKVGDVIEKIGDKTVAQPEDVKAALANVDLKEGVILHLRNAEGKRFVILKSVDE